MAKQTTTDEPTMTSDERIAAILERLAESAPAEEIGYGHPKYQQRLRDEGVFAEFAHPVYQNGKLAQARGLKPETIARAPQLTPGRYLGGKVEVLKDSRDRIHLFYKASKVEDRMRFQAVVKDFDDLIDQVWRESHPEAVAV